MSMIRAKESAKMPQRLNIAEESSSASDVLTLKNGNKKLLKTLYDQKSVGQFCEVQFKIDDEVVHVHACVLASFSSLMAEILKKFSMTNDDLLLKTPLTIDLCMIFDDLVNVCSACFTKIIDFMYLGNILIDSVHINHLETLSKKLDVNELILFCSRYRYKMNDFLFNNDTKKSINDKHIEVNSIAPIKTHYRNIIDVDKNIEIDNTLIDKILQFSNFARTQSGTETVLKECENIIDISCETKFNKYRKADKKVINTTRNELVTDEMLEMNEKSNTFDTVKNTTEGEHNDLINIDNNFNENKQLTENNRKSIINKGVEEDNSEKCLSTNLVPSTDITYPEERQGLSVNVQTGISLDSKRKNEESNSDLLKKKVKINDKLKSQEGKQNLSKPVNSNRRVDDLTYQWKETVEDSNRILINPKTACPINTLCGNFTNICQFGKSACKENKEVGLRQENVTSCSSVDVCKINEKAFKLNHVSLSSKTVVSHLSNVVHNTITPESNETSALKENTYSSNVTDLHEVNNVIQQQNSLLVTCSEIKLTNTDEVFSKENHIHEKSRAPSSCQLSTISSGHIQMPDVFKEVTNSLKKIYNNNTFILKEQNVITIEEVENERSKEQVRSNMFESQIKIDVSEKQIRNDVLLDKELKSNMFVKQMKSIDLSKNETKSNVLDKKNTNETSKEDLKNGSSEMFNVKTKLHLSEDVIKNHESNKRMKSRRHIYCCSFCSFFTARLCSFITHLICTNHEYTECLICNYKLEDKSLLKGHLQNHMGPKPFFCHMCDKRFSTRQLLKQHMFCHSPDYFPCKICNKNFKRQGNLKAHILSKHKKVVSNKSKTLKTYECPLAGCKYKTDRQFDLNEHIKSHSKQKDFQCDICKICFSLRKNLQRHIGLQHNKTFFKCILCKFKTTRADKLQSHYSQKHKVDKLTKDELNVLSSGDEIQIYNLLQIKKKHCGIRPTNSSIITCEQPNFQKQNAEINNEENLMNSQLYISPSVGSIFTPNVTSSKPASEVSNGLPYDPHICTIDCIVSASKNVYSLRDELSDVNANDRTEEDKIAADEIGINHNKNDTSTVKNTDQAILVCDRSKNNIANEEKNVMSTFIIHDSVLRSYSNDKTSINLQNTSDTNEEMYALNEATGELIKIGLDSFSDFHGNIKLNSKNLSNEDNLDFTNISVHSNAIVQGEHPMIKSIRNTQKFVTECEKEKEMVNLKQFNSNISEDVHIECDDVQRISYTENNKTDLTQANSSINDNQSSETCLLNEIVEDVSFGSYKNSSRYNDESNISCNKSDPVINWHEFNSDILSFTNQSKEVNYVYLNNKELSPDEYILNEQTGNIIFPAPFLNEGTGELSVIKMTIDPVQFINMGHVECNEINNMDTQSVASDDNNVDFNIEQSSMPNNIFNIPFEPPEPEGNCDNGGNFLNELTGELCEQYLKDNFCSQSIVNEFIDKSNINKCSVLDEATGELLENSNTEFDENLFKENDMMILNETTGEISINSTHHDSNNPTVGYSWNDWFFDSFQDDSIDSFSLEKKMLPDDIALDELFCNKSDLALENESADILLNESTGELVKKDE